MRNTMSVIGHKIETTCDIFGTLVQKKCLLVDKTLMIKAFFDGQDVSLITRPRRFGKTITLSMLQHFFSAHVSGQPTRGLFDDFAIAKVDDGAFLNTHQGQYPVIFMTFKDAKKASYEETIEYIGLLIREAYEEHNSILDSPLLETIDKENIKHYLLNKLTPSEMTIALKKLCYYLSIVYDKQAIILIDEYDSPLTSAYQHTPKHLVDSDEGFLCRISYFMRDLFSAALKTNPYLYKGLMTGILRVSKNNMLSGLNNLEVFTLLDDNYASYFGFSEQEVLELLDHQQSRAEINKVRAYYNGYQIGGQVMYNPWSFMHYLDNHELCPYWIATSNDAFLRDLFIHSDETTKAQLRRLMLNQSIEGEINLNLGYEKLLQRPDALWTLLLFCGYLTFSSKKLSIDNWSCTLRVPNTEVMAQYRRIFLDWLQEKIGRGDYTPMLSHLVLGNISLFMRALHRYLMNSLSFHDISGPKSERFYHGFVLGLIASICDTHLVSSNHESGYGLHDVMITPKTSAHHVGIVIEFKYSKTMGVLQNDALDALDQIGAQHYDTLLMDNTHITQIVHLGISFCKKGVMAVYQTKDKSTQITSEPVWWEMPENI